MSTKILVRALCTLGVFIFLASPLVTEAATYYISSTGLDSNNGTSISTPWQTLAKVNATNFAPGDTILFKRGDSWEGTLTPATSGTAGNVITFGAYDTGDKPKIYGSTIISGWTQYAGNIYKATFNSTITQLFINDARLQAARYPNTGYFYPTTVASSTQFTSTSLSSAINYTGAKLLIRDLHYKFSLRPITASTSNTLTLSSPTNSGGLATNQGFILVDKLEFLDSAGEWYYDTATKTVYLWTPNGDTPANYTVRGSIYDNGIYATKSYIRFQDFQILQSAQKGIWGSNMRFTTINNIDITNPNFYGIHVAIGLQYNNTITNNTVTGANGDGFVIYSDNSTISNNTISNIALFDNLGVSGTNTSSGMQINGSTNTISYNRITDVAYNGISFSGINYIVENNYINGANKVLDDGGGIYTYSGNYTSPGSAGSIIRKNIVLNVHGNRNGVKATYDSGIGIYLDNNIHDVLVEDNLIAYTSNAILVNSGAGLNTINRNTVIDSMLLMQMNNQTDPTTVTNNIFYATNRLGSQNFFTNSTQRLSRINSTKKVLNNNTYIHHYSSTNLFIQSSTYYSFAGWKTITGQESTSTFDGATLGGLETEELFYNDLQTVKTISLGANAYRDLSGNTVTGSLVLDPFTSKILINTGVAAADTTAPSVSLTAPTTNATLSGTTTLSATATDNIGVSTVNFFYGTTLIAADTVAPYTASWNTTLVPNGTYILKAIAADAAGNTASTATVSVTVSNVASIRTTPATYYISSTGSDTNNGTSTTTPWQTLTKVNATTFIPGDNILFKKGDTFYGSITVNQSGTVGNPITFSSYGTGTNPIITGFTDVTAWTNLGNNIWESTAPVSTLATLNMVTVGGVNTAMGRWPNADAAWGGYLSKNNGATTTSFTSTNLTGTPNWTGAETVIRTTSYTLERSTITSQTGGTLVYNTLSSAAQDLYGFFIQNDIRTLDQQNEWYYNPTTKKLSMYSIGQPSNIKVASIDKLFEFKNINNSTKGSYSIIQNITFEGSNQNVFTTGYNNPKINNVTIQNNEIRYAGVNAIQIKGDYITIENNTIVHANSKAIDLAYSTYVTVRNNTITNIGLYPGMAGSGWYGLGSAVRLGGTTTQTTMVVEYNTITNVGYNAIGLGDDITLIKNNLIDTFCTVLDDGGGIYGWKTGNAEIVGNIIINGIGNKNGYSGTFPTQAVGIYLDYHSYSNVVHGNSVSNTAAHGIFLNENKNTSVYDNTVYNTHNANPENNQANQIAINGDSTVGYEARNITVNNNTFVAKSIDQQIAGFASGVNDIPLFGTFNNNYYIRPLDLDGTLFWLQQPNVGSLKNKTLAQWQSFSSQDANSKKSPVALTSENDIFFDYNATTTNKTVSLPWPAVDMNGTKRTGTVTMLPYTSVTYLKDPSPTLSDTTAPTVSLTAPTNNATISGIATLSANASDNIGVTRVDFLYGTTVIGSDTVSPYTASWNTTLVQNGTYTLKAIAYDAAGNSTTSTVVPVTVSNIASDLGITLTAPVTSTTVSGTIAVTAVPTGSSIARVDYFKDTDTAPFAMAVSSFTVFFDTTILTDGTHTFKAVVYNTSGASTPSAVVEILVSNGGLPRVNPSAPQLVVAQVGNARAKINWTPPASAGASAITSYTITSSPGNVTTNSIAAPFIMTGLANGTPYTFTVRANNSLGAGDIVTTNTIIPRSIFPIGSSVRVSVAGKLNVRSSPNGTKTGVTSNGALGTVLANSGTWTQVQFTNVTGWVSNMYLFVQ